MVRPISYQWSQYFPAGVNHQMATSNITAYLSEHTDRLFVRDSTAGFLHTTVSFLPLLNASNASRSLYLPVQGVLVGEMTCFHLNAHYTIFDLLRGIRLGVVDDDNEHKELVRLLRQRIRDQTCVIDSDVSMGEAAKTSLISSGLQKPDVILFKNINDESHPVVLIEVESSSSVLNTVNKLAKGIMCQIIHLRNTGHTTNTLTGFFILLNPGNAEEVTVTFNESLLRFDLNSW